MGEYNGQPVTDLDVDIFEDKPWRKPGADITDYFNYGFNEVTWRAYCAKQKTLRDRKVMGGWKAAKGPILFFFCILDHSADRGETGRGNAWFHGRCPWLYEDGYDDANDGRWDANGDANGDDEPNDDGYAASPSSPFFYGWRSSDDAE